MRQNEKNKEFIYKLNNEKDLEKICDLFDEYSKNYKNAKLIYFNLGMNPELNLFKNKLINGYSIMGVSDYDRAYIFDNNYNSKSSRQIGIGKTINLDLNVLTYLKNIVNGRTVNDKDNFIFYLKYIKELKYNLNMSVALMERISKPVDKNVWKDYILAYVKYEELDNVTEDTLVNNRLSEDGYNWAKKIYDAKYEIFNNFYIIACLLSKALILKMEKKDLNLKFKELLNYSLNELNIYSEFELYLIYKYLHNDMNVEKCFSKMKIISKNTLDNIKNITWDILHIRLMEFQMLNDLKEGCVIFHYLGTKDRGLQDIIKINPIKIMGFLDDKEIIVREDNSISNIELFDILQNYEKNNKNVVDYKKKFEEISKEITNLIK